MYKTLSLEIVKQEWGSFLFLHSHAYVTFQMQVENIHQMKTWKWRTCFKVRVVLTYYSASCKYTSGALSSIGKYPWSNF